MSRTAYQPRMTSRPARVMDVEEKKPEVKYSGAYRALQDFSVFFGNTTLHYKTGDVIVSGAHIKYLLDSKSPIIRDEDANDLLKCPHCGHSFYQN